MSKPKRVQKQNGIQGIEKDIMLLAAKDYCHANKLSLEKLGRQILIVFDNSIVFATPGNVKSDGLKNDIECQPKPVLIAEMKAGELVFQQTPLTSELLSV